MFIDAHLHTIRSQGLPRNGAGENFATPEELLLMMDRTGVERGLLLPEVSPECAFQMSTNEDILDVCAQYPERFIPCCNIDPRAGSNCSSTDLSAHLSYYIERGCKGFGEISANLSFTDPLVLNLLHHCEATGLPVVFHIAPRRGGCYGLIDGLGLPGLEEVLRCFPELTFIGHSQPFWSEICGRVNAATRNTYPAGPVAPGGAVPRLLESYPNLCCGWDAGSGYNALVRDPEFGYTFMETFADRILFGTDICSPTNDHQHAAYLTAALREGRISADTFTRISWQNANRVFRLGLA